MEILGAPIANGANVFMKHSVEHGDVVGHEHLFLPLKCGFDFGHDVRKVDFHLERLPNIFLF